MFLFFFVFVFCVCVICVCFSPFCDLYTYISPWNSGKNKLAVAQRRIQTLFWRDFPEVMRRKAEVALLQKHGLNDANPDCLIVLVCQGPLNGVTGFLEISRFPCNCLRIHSFFLVLFGHFPRLHGGDPAFLMMWLAFLKTRVCNCLYVKATAKMLWDEEVFLFFGGGNGHTPIKTSQKAMVFEGRKGFMAQWISVVMGHPTGWGSEAWKPGRSVDECEGPDRLIRGMSRSVITWRVCKFHHQDDRRFFWDLDPKYKPSWKPRLRGGGGSIPKCLRIWELTHGSWGPGR